MNLKQFISESLKQILEGIREAQATEGGENVNARHAFKDVGGSLLNAGEYGVFTRVDFDVSVSAETNAKGGAALKVFGIGMDAGGAHKAETANRITFSVPIRLPSGDTEVAKEVTDRKAKAAAERSAKLRNRSTSWT